MANILVIDDTPVTHRLLEIILKKFDHSMISAFNGQEALDLLKDNQVDMAIVDVLMPVMDGFSLIRKMRSDKRTQFIPIAVMTASADPNMPKKASAAGANAFLSQPFSAGEIRELVLRCIPS